MTRNRFFRFMSPPRRRRGIAALVTAAVVSQSFAPMAVSNAVAQTTDNPSNIQQVVGKELNGSRRTSNYRSGGLLSGLFGSRSSSSSSSSSSEPYRKATPVPNERDVDWAGVPYHGATPSRTASKNAAPVQDPSAASRSTRIADSSGAVPTPPPMSVSRQSIASSTPRKLENQVSSAPAAVISSERPEPLSVTRSSRRPTATVTAPTKLSTSTPALVAKSDKPVELVPRVSRKAIQIDPAPKAVASSPVKSARRAAPAVVASKEVTPKKVEPKVEAPKIVQKPIAKPAPAPAQKPAPAPTQVAAQPVQKPAAKPATETSKFTLGAARQVDSARNSATNRVAAKPQPAMSLPVDNTAVATSRPQAPRATLGTVTQSAQARMSTFGSESDATRAGGSLNAGNGNIALHPISDRLPAEQNEAIDPMQAWHDSQNVSHDGFAARGTSIQARTAAGPTSPSYHSAANQNSGYHQTPPTYNSAYPNAMRGTLGTPQSAVAAPAPANTNNTATELPGIRVLTAGPRHIMIRQTHPYEVIVENRGSVAAEGLLVRAHIPDWADVVGQQVTRGDVTSDSIEAVRNLHWKIDRLEAGQTEKMFVRLKAARSGTHDLDVDWTLSPQSRSMQVVVQEPELALTIDGPDEVIYGQSKTYQIRVLNPGDGIAPDVVFTLSPKSSSPQSQRIGDIPAGKEAQFEVELTAQDLGELKIHGLAIGDLELRAEADKTIRVLAADLEAILSGPEVKYQNTDAVYQLELTNHGTAASDEVIANLTLPTGVTYQGGMEGATMIDNQLRWKIASLTPGAVRKYQFQCRMEATGTQNFTFDCKGSAAGQTNVALDTSVEAIADLVLSIEDPSAPAPIGENVSYQIVIRNRGSKPASDVRAVAQFSHGIEPKQISGHAGKVITGQVLIEPIARIEAGEEVRVTIVAQAETSGHHRFRTEVRSGDTVLVAEEATHYLSPRNDRISRRSGPGGNEFSLPLR
ncbi:hypothetical protein SAMN06265222_101240 [Neorhodopirellula lusitana]|uniref:DUF11 domain-containing protein n=1 Tax=Neorhodopirellula lusitana TaxID=445327 RepID=A0ABY1PNB7_9BACT|nr:hypothetical protein [Neorhodopirellula lusitana]SMP39056.1 hypothetical protein SAMN06265222_101240 [Neorhodopirellula lusitana]